MTGFWDSEHPALPALYMIVAVIFYSAIPLFFDLGGADESPFLFAGIWLNSIGIGTGAVILLLNRGLLLKKTVREDVVSRWKTRLMFFSALGLCGHALFALGLAYIDVSVAAILYETWPIILIFIMSRLFKDTERYQQITLGTWFFVLLSLIGVALVILGHNETPPNPLDNWAGFTDLGTWVGVFLVMASAVGGGANGACTLKLGISLSKRHLPAKNQKTGEIVFVMVVSCMAQIIAGVVLCVTGLLASETISSHQLFYAFVSGLFVASIGVVAFRAANLKTTDLGVNALAYATPLVALVWLWVVSTLDVPRLDLLIIGAMGIVASNLLINVDASTRIAYKSLVVSLWLFGTVTYLTEGYATDVPIELPVTVFILVLAFRVDRLVRRTSQEEEWVFDVFHRLRLMAKESVNVVNRGKGRHQHQVASKALLEASKTLLRIDNHKNTMELATEYKNMVGCLNRALAAGCAAAEISSIRRVVDKLSHSRQQGSRLGEIVAIFLAGALIVFGLLVFSGERDVYGEVTSFVLSSVVVFLFCNILDLQQDREDETMIEGNMKEYKHGEFVVNFTVTTNRKKQQYISMAISVVIVAVFVWLFFARA